VDNLQVTGNSAMEAPLSSTQPQIVETEVTNDMLCIVVEMNASGSLMIFSSFSFIINRTDI